MEPMVGVKFSASVSLSHDTHPIVPSTGPIAKSFPPHITEIHSATLDALEAVGLPRNPDNVCFWL